MKKIFYTLCLLIGATSAINAQVVNIPDANFKAYLLGNSGINTNGDGEIQVSEAAAFTGTIHCPSKNISSLTGIEAFIHLTELDCYNNQLTNLDVSQNTDLTHLACDGNQLTNLDVSQNTDLIGLYCDNNQLTSLDLSQNPALITLVCYNNQLTNLDMSQNPALAEFFCYSNQLTNLNIKNGKNTLLSGFSCVTNPNLNCIQVDDVDYANSHFFSKDATASYSTDCAFAVTDFSKKEILLFPNPVKDILNFSEEVANIRIINLSGRLIKEISHSRNSVDVSGLAKGIYIISTETKSKNRLNQKFIKE